MVDLTFAAVLQTSTTPQQILGTRANLPFGSTWTYTKMNEAILKGHCVSPVAAVGVDLLSSSTNNAGQIVYVTKAAAGWTAGQFANCWLTVDDGTGEGQVARIKTNDATTLELYPEWALTTALAVADSDITISYVNQLSEKLPITVKTSLVIGAAQVAFASQEYGWVLSQGPGICISGTAAMTAEKNFTPGDDTEGQVVIGVTAEGNFNGFTAGYSLAANSTIDLGFLAMMAVPQSA